VLVTSGGAEPPYAVSAVTLADGIRHGLVRGNVDYANWNR